MRRKNILSFVARCLAVPALLLLGSCVDQIEGPAVADATLNLLFYEPETLTKSSIQTSDTRINDVNLYAYVDGKLNRSFYLDEKTKQVNLVPGVEYELFALCNAGKPVEAPQALSDLGDLLLTVRGVDVFSATGLPMASAPMEPTVLRQGENTLSFPVSRLVSKWNIRVDRTALERSDIEITSLVIVNAALNVTPFRSRSKATAVGDGDHATAADIHNLNLGQAVQFFTLENCRGTLLEAGATPADRVYDKLPSTERDYCTYVELTCRYTSDGGAASSQNMKYRFYLGANTTDNFDVVRNTTHTLTLSLSDEGAHEGSWRVDLGDITDTRSIAFSSAPLIVEGGNEGVLSIVTKPASLEYSVDVDDAAVQEAKGSYTIEGNDIRFSFPETLEQPVNIPVSVTSWDGRIKVGTLVRVLATYSVAVTPEESILYYGRSADLDVIASANASGWTYAFDENSYLSHERTDKGVRLTNRNNTGRDLVRTLTVSTPEEQGGQTVTARVVLKTEESIRVDREEMTLRYLQSGEVFVSAVPSDQIWTFSAEGPVELYREGNVVTVTNRNGGEKAVTATVKIATEDGNVVKTVSVLCHKNQEASMTLSSDELRFGESATVSIHSTEEVSLLFRDANDRTVDSALLPSRYGLTVRMTGDAASPCVLTYDAAKLAEDATLQVVAVLPDGSEAVKPLLVKTYVETVSVSPASVTLAYQQSARVAVNAFPSEGWTFSVDKSTNLVSFTAADDGIIITNANTTADDIDLILTVRSADGTATATVAVKAVGGRGEVIPEYAPAVLTIVCDDVPARGGSVTKGTKVTYSQTYTPVTHYTDGTTSRGEPQVTDGELDIRLVTWSDGARDIQPKPAQESPRTPTGFRLKAGAKVNGVDSEGEVDVFQEANSLTDETFVIEPVTLTPEQVPASGGKVTISGGAGYRVKTYTSGATARVTETVSRSMTTHNASSAFVATLTDNEITIPSLGTTLVREGQYKLLLTLEDQSVIKTITQAENKVEQTNVKDNTLSFALAEVSDIPASGGSTTQPAVSDVRYSRVTEYTYSSGKVYTETAGGGTSYNDYSIAYSNDGVSFSPHFSPLSATTLGASEKARTLIGKHYVRVKDNASGTETVKSVEVHQQANVRSMVSAGGTRTTAYTPVLSSASVAAGGGSISVSGKKTVEVTAPKYSYTSGATSQAATTSRDESLVPESVTVAPASKGATVAGTTVTVSRNYGAARSWTVTATAEEHSGTATLSQAEGSDVISSTAYTISPLSLSSGEVGAGGGTVTVSGGEVTATHTWASGRTTKESKGTATLSVGAHSLLHDLRASISGSTVTVPTLGSRLTDRGSYTITATYSSGGVSASSVTATLYQGANSRTKTAEGSETLVAWSITLSPETIDSDGGPVTVNGRKTVKTTYPQYKYSSGAVESQSASTATSDAAPQSISLSPTTGVTVASSSSVNVGRNYDVQARDWTVSALYDGMTATATLRQDAGSDPASSVAYIISDISLSSGEVGAGGGTVTVSGGDVTEVTTHASGAVSNRDIGKATLSVSAHSKSSAFRGSVSGTTVTIPSLKITALPAGSYTVTATYSSGGVSAEPKTVTIRQAANSETLNETLSAYGTPTVTIGEGITAAGGSATVTASVKDTYTVTRSYSSGESASPTNEMRDGNIRLTIHSNPSGRFSLNGTILSHSSMLTDVVTDNVVIRALNTGDESKYGEASKSVTNSVTSETISIGDISASRYGTPEAPCPSSGGTATIGGGAGTIVRTYASGCDPVTDSFTPNKSVSANSANSAFTATISAAGVVTIPDLGKSSVNAGYYIVTYSYSGCESKTCKIYQDKATSTPGVNGEAVDWENGGQIGG